MEGNNLRNLETLLREILKERAQPGFNIMADIRDVTEVLSKTYSVLVKSTGHTITDIPEHLETVAAWMCGKGRPGLLIYGGYGTGKTTTIRAIRCAIRFFRPTHNVRHLTSKQVVVMPYDAFKTLYRGNDLVIIDEFGREQDERREYGNVSEPMVDLISFREDRGLPTVLASNLTDDEISEKYGPYIRDRLAGSYSRLFLDGDSRRAGW